MNLTFSTKVVMFGTIIGVFPKPLKPCIVPSVRVSFLLKPTLASCHACYRTSPPRFDKQLNSSDLWSRSDLPRWRSMGKTGVIVPSRCVRPLFLAIFSLHGWFTERYVDVAHERGKGSGEVPRRRGTAIAPAQSCIYPCDVFGKG